MANISLGNTVTTGLVFSSDTTGNLVLTSTGGYLNLGSVTGGIVLPTGNSSQRPSTVANGTLRYNTTTSSVEGYVAGAWGAIGGAGGGITWANVQTGNFTAATGNAYPVNTTSSAVYVTLPSSPGAGNIVQILDYARTFGTNNCTVNPNGGKILSSNANVSLSTNGTSVALVYIDSTQGWLPYDGFLSPPIGQYSVDYLIVAGGGGGAAGYGGGGGGGGGVLAATTTVSPGTAYSITVGAGGAGYPGYNTGGWIQNHGANGAPSVGLSATATGGGGGGGGGTVAGYSGGSGGGGGDSSPGGSGTVGQGYAGGAGVPGSAGPNYGAGGGGGAGGVGSGGTNVAGGNGGTGASSSISGAATYYAGGGGGGTYNGGTAGTGGNGGGGSGSNGSPAAGSATTNTGGGGGGGAGYNSGSPNASGGAGNGGSGIVIIRYLGGQRATGGTVTSSGGYTIHTFTVSGTFTA